MVFGLVPKTCCFSGKKSLKTGRSFFLEKSDVSPFGYPLERRRILLLKNIW